MKRLIVFSLALVFVSLACVQSATLAEPAPSPTVTEISSGAVYWMPTVTALPKSRCARVTAPVSLHLRLQSNAGSHVIAYLLHGDIVTVIDKLESDWWLVDHVGVSGYARSKYLEIVECE